MTFFKPGRLTHTVAVVLSSITSVFTHSAPAKIASNQVKIGKKAEWRADDSGPTVQTIAFRSPSKQPAAKRAERYPWKREIVTTVFWIGEQPSFHNPVPNRASSWDKNWTRNYGGFDNPEPSQRIGY